MKRYRANCMISKEFLKYGNIDISSIKKRELIRSLSEKMVEDENDIVSEINNGETIDGNNFEIDIFVLSMNEILSLQNAIIDIKDLIPFDKYMKIVEIFKS